MKYYYYYYYSYYYYGGGVPVMVSENGTHITIHPLLESVSVYIVTRRRRDC